VSIAIAPDRTRYTVVLAAFEGTLSELAHALRTGRLAPEALDLLALVRDFLVYFARHADGDLELATEALPAVAHVIELKTRLLLPRPPRVEPDDVEAARVEALEAVELLERLEGAIAFLRERRERRRYLVPARATPPTFERRVRPLDLAVGALTAAAARYRLGAYFEIARDRLSVPEAMRRIVERLAALGRSGLHALAAPGDWGARTVYFAALLELVKERLVEADQAEPFADIAVTLRRPGAPPMTEIPPASADQE
jgi:segregation and condensation protein A